MSDNVLIVLIPAVGALILGIINIIVAWKKDSKKDRQRQHDQLIARLDKMEKTLGLNTNGLQAVLRSQLYDMWGHCKCKGYADDLDRENFLNLYDKYHVMGANGVMDHVKDQFLELPTSKKPIIRRKKEVMG